MLDLDYTVMPSDVVVAWVQLVLQKYYTKVRAKGRSFGVTTISGFDLDMFPPVAMSHREGPLWIPDRDAGEWVPSHPKGQIAFGVSRNEATYGYYKHLVKIMRHWRDRLTPAAIRAKSYVLESFVAETIQFKPLYCGRGVQQFLLGIDVAYTPFVAAKVVPTIAGPGYPSVNVTKRWKFEEFSAFMQRVRNDRAIAVSALSKDDQNKSVAFWRRLFGNAFAPRS